MDSEYHAKIFFARKHLLGSLESPTLLPENGLLADGLLDSGQLKKVNEIRHRRFHELADTFPTH